MYPTHHGPRIGLTLLVVVLLRLLIALILRGVCLRVLNPFGVEYSGVVSPWEGIPKNLVCLSHIGPSRQVC